MENSYFISKEDWSLHRKGEDDQRRHQQKIREAILNKLPELISNESLILSNGKSKVHIPIRSLEEYRFRYNFNKQQHIGSGQPTSKPGEKVGDAPGEDWTDAEIAIDDIEPLLFASLELPHLLPKPLEQLNQSDIIFTDIRKSGIQSNLDLKRTLIETIRRHAKSNQPKLQIKPDDLRFKTWNDIYKPHSNAVILAMMDTSGSMGQLEKYCARSFFFWMTRFLRSKYEQVEIVFIAHHTKAMVVTEEQFFSRGESGGTICSSAYELANSLVEKNYPPEQYNIYPVHFSDGDNLLSDNPKCVTELKLLLNRAAIIGYAEINPYSRTSTMMQAFRSVNDARFLPIVIRDRNEVYKALTHIFGKK
jgi:sporulation protein YhbH